MCLRWVHQSSVLSYADAGPPWGGIEEGNGHKHRDELLTALCERHGCG